MREFRMTEAAADALDADHAATLLAAVKMIEARAQLRAIQIASFPHMDKVAQEKLHKAIYSEAYPAEMEEIRPIEKKDLARFGFGGC